MMQIDDQVVLKVKAAKARQWDCDVFSRNFNNTLFGSGRPADYLDRVRPLAEQLVNACDAFETALKDLIGETVTYKGYSGLAQGRVINVTAFMPDVMQSTLLIDVPGKQAELVDLVKVQSMPFGV